MASVSIKQLLESGVHFGHQTKRWNPKMARYIFGEKNGIYVIDLQKTMENLKTALKIVTEIVSKGNTVLLVGTKKQAQDVIKEEAERCKMYYVNKRWLGGTLTNFETIRKGVKRLNEIRKMFDDKIVEKLSKKEEVMLGKERDKLFKNLSGIVDMEKLPAVLFAVDPKKEMNAIKEAKKLGIPTIGLVDTNCDPEVVDYCIPGNDDAIRAIKLIASAIAEAAIEGKEIFLSSGKKKKEPEAEVKKLEVVEEKAKEEVKEEAAEVSESKDYEVAPPEEVIEEVRDKVVVAEEEATKEIEKDIERKRILGERRRKQ